MKKYISKSTGSKGKKCLSTNTNNNNNNNKKGADQDIQLALALSISMLPQVQDDGFTPARLDLMLEEDVSAGINKRKRVRLDRTEVPALLVTSDQDYSASVARRAHNILDISSHGTATHSNTTSDDSQECSLWNLSSLSELESDQEFVIGLLKETQTPVLHVETPLAFADSYTIVYDSNSPLISAVFSGYFLNPFLSDTVLVTKDSYKLPSHLFILAAHSALIRDLLSERYNMNKIFMRGHEVHTVVPLLEFMYLGKFQFESIHLETTKKLASILQMETFLTCLEEHQKIANPVQKRVDCEESQPSQEIVSPESKSQTSLPEIFSKSLKDCSKFEIAYSL